MYITVCTSTIIHEHTLTWNRKIASLVFYCTQKDMYKILYWYQHCTTKFFKMFYSDSQHYKFTLSPILLLLTFHTSPYFILHLLLPYSLPYFHTTTSPLSPPPPPPRPFLLLLPLLLWRELKPLLSLLWLRGVWEGTEIGGEGVRRKGKRRKEERIGRSEWGKAYN